MNPNKKFKERQKELKAYWDMMESFVVYKNTSKKKLSKSKLEWKAYRQAAWRVTKEQDLSQLSGIEMRSINGYHVDHIVSIWDGWKHGIPYERIGHISNLRVIPAEENLRKSRSSDQDHLVSLIREISIVA